MDINYIHGLREIGQKIMLEAKRIEDLEKQIKIYESQLFHMQLSTKRSPEGTERFKGLIKQVKIEILVAKANLLQLQQQQKELEKGRQITPTSRRK